MIKNICDICKESQILSQAYQIRNGKGYFYGEIDNAIVKIFKIELVPTVFDDICMNCLEKILTDILQRWGK